MSMFKLTPTLLLNAYAQGIFPMAHKGEIYWFDPDPRAILPLDEFIMSRSLARVMKRVLLVDELGRKRPFVTGVVNKSAKPPLEIRLDTAFADVIAACADQKRPGGWINDEIIAAYIALHEKGWAHSVETWQDGELVGGLYGVAIRGLFAGESMFSRVNEASKVALVGLVDHLKGRGYALLDVQFQTAHLARFGVVEIAREEYKNLLEKALEIKPTFV